MKYENGNVVMTHEEVEWVLEGLRQVFDPSPEEIEQILEEEEKLPLKFKAKREYKDALEGWENISDFEMCFLDDCRETYEFKPQLIIISELNCFVIANLAGETGIDNISGRIFGDITGDFVLHEGSYANLSYIMNCKSKLNVPMHIVRNKIIRTLCQYFNKKYANQYYHGWHFNAKDIMKAVGKNIHKEKIERKKINKKKSTNIIIYA